MTIILVTAVLAVAVPAVLYNGLVRARNRAEEAFSQIDVQLKRRLDLIPSLVAAVGGYANHEKQTLERAIAARARGLETDAQGRTRNDGEAREAVRGLVILAEAYPDLKADQQFLLLQEELTSTENRIAFARQFFNDTARIYNTRVESLPWLLLAGPLGFERRDLFEAEDTTAPAVRF